MGLLQSIGFGGTGGNKMPSAELPDIFPFPTSITDFVKMDVDTIFKRILTDVIERTHGLKDEHAKLLSDNCLATESRDGLVTMLATAMRSKSELFLVYDKALNLIQKADQAEQETIKREFKEGAKKPSGIYISFKNYTLADMMQIYSNFEYYAVSGLHKNMNLAKALQLKFDALRSSVGANDAAAIIEQAQAIATALSNGKSVAMDAKDIIEIATPSMDATTAVTNFIAQKRSFYLGLPASWITGLAPKGLGDTGEGDAKAVERGLKGYFSSIIKPVVEALFGTPVSFKSDDSYGLSTALEVVKTFDLISDEYLDAEQKKIITHRAFNLALEKAK